LSEPATTTLHRYAWQAGGQTLSRVASFVALVITARELGLSGYGRFVVLLALLEAAMVPWKATVLQAAAAGASRTEEGIGWGRTTAGWWVLGSLVLGPVAFVFDGALGAASLLAASAASGLMFLHVPALFLAGRQRRFALGTLGAQTTRLTVTVILVLADSLTPRTALLAAGVGSLAGALAMRGRMRSLGGKPQWYGKEVATEGLRWAELHAPILLVAVLLGLQSAGGFDLLYKMVQAAAQIMAGIGVVMLPAFGRGEEPPSATLARSLRLPSVFALVVAGVAMVGMGSLLDTITGSQLGLGLAPIAMSPVLILAPWMGVSRTALVVLGGSHWLIPSQMAVSVATVGAGLLAYRGVLWAAVAIAAAGLVGAAIRWLGLRSLDHLPRRGWLAPAEWRRDLAWLRDAALRKGRR